MLNFVTDSSGDAFEQYLQLLFRFVLLVALLKSHSVLLLQPVKYILIVLLHPLNVVLSLFNSLPDGPLGTIQTILIVLVESKEL